MMVNINHLNTSGPIGTIENGSGSIAGVIVRWQIQATTGGFAENGWNSNLRFVTWDEPPSHFRAQLNHDGLRSEPRITLLFNSSSDRSKVLNNIPCIWQ